MKINKSIANISIFITLIFSLILLSMVSSSCSLYKALTMSKPEVVGLDKIGIKNINFDEAVLVFSVKMKNDNSFSVGIVRSEYDVYVNDVYIGKGNIVNRQVLNPETESIVDIPLTIKRRDSNTETLKIFLDIIQGERLNYSIDGNITVDIDGDEYSAPMKIKKQLSALKL